MHTEKQRNKAKSKGLSYLYSNTVANTRRWHAGGKMDLSLHWATLDKSLVCKVKFSNVSASMKLVWTLSILRSYRKNNITYVHIHLCTAHI